MKKSINTYFLIHKDTHLLDLSGACQVIYEANNRVKDDYILRFVSITDKIKSAQGLEFSSLELLSDINLSVNDILFVPGVDFQNYISNRDLKMNSIINDWIYQQYKSGAKICSICSGALILADSGILNNKECTSHWKCIDYLKKQYPKVRVSENRIFVKDENIYTSAGMTSGIDMTLSIIEEMHGPLITAEIAREMVVYIRRSGSNRQISHYLDYKTHFDPKIHKVQNIICSNLSINYTNQELASMANMSERNITRVFKKACGLSISKYKNKMKVELINHLKHNKNMSVEQLASECGFKNSRQLYRIIKNE